MNSSKQLKRLFFFGVFNFVKFNPYLFFLTKEINVWYKEYLSIAPKKVIFYDKNMDFVLNMFPFGLCFMEIVLLGKKAHTDILNRLSSYKYNKISFRYPSFYDEPTNIKQTESIQLMNYTEPFIGLQYIEIKNYPFHLDLKFPENVQDIVLKNCGIYFSRDISPKNIRLLHLEGIKKMYYPIEDDSYFHKCISVRELTIIGCCMDTVSFFNRHALFYSVSKLVMMQRLRNPFLSFMYRTVNIDNLQNITYLEIKKLSVLYTKTNKKIQSLKCGVFWYLESDDYRVLDNFVFIDFLLFKKCKKNLFPINVMYNKIQWED